MLGTSGSGGGGAARVTHHDQGPSRRSRWRAAVPRSPVRLSPLGSSRSRPQELSRPAEESLGVALGGSQSPGGRTGNSSARGSGGRRGSPLEGRFRGVEEEEMLLLFSPSPGSFFSSFGPRPQPLGGEEVVALYARGCCRRPAPTPRPLSPRLALQ